VFVAYVSLDEVNQDLLSRMADRCGVFSQCFGSLSDLEHVPCDAAIYDFDYLCAEEHRRIFEKLTSAPVDGLAAVHGYNLLPRQKRALRQNGVVVRRRLHAKWLSRLFRRKKAKAVQLLLAAG
jgi:hypothetical protein